MRLKKADRGTSPLLDVGQVAIDTGSTRIDVGGSFIDLGDDDTAAASQDDEFAPDDVLREVAYTDNFEDDTKSELEVVRSAAYQALVKSNRAIADAIDFRYLAVVVFQSRRQRAAFIEASRLEAEDGIYIDGLDLARRLGIVVPDEAIGFREAHADRALGSLPVVGE